MKKFVSQKIYYAIGVLSLIMGFIGVFLPIWPTTPFIIVAAWAFQKGSPRIHSWLVNHPVVGPPLVSWQSHGVISKKAKIASTVMLTISFSWVLYSRPIAFTLKVFMALFAFGVCVFIITRPSKIPPPKS